jgi:hypothetical protein
MMIYVSAPFSTDVEVNRVWVQPHCAAYSVLHTVQNNMLSTSGMHLHL